MTLQSHCIEVTHNMKGMPTFIGMASLLLAFLLMHLASSSLADESAVHSELNPQPQLHEGEGGGGGHPDGQPHLMQPTPTWECDVCELLIEEVVPILKVNSSMGETAFHREMDDLCVSLFSHDPWLIGFCQSVVRRNLISWFCFYNTILIFNLNF